MLDRSEQNQDMGEMTAGIIHQDCGGVSSRGRKGHNEDAIAVESDINWDEKVDRGTLASVLGYRSFFELLNAVTTSNEYLQGLGLSVVSVADGVGGADYGEYASRIAVASFIIELARALQNLHATHDQSRLTEGIKQAYAKSNNILLTFNAQNQNTRTFTTFRAAVSYFPDVSDVYRRVIVVGTGDTNCIRIDAQSGQRPTANLVVGNEVWKQDGKTGPQVMGDPKSPWTIGTVDLSVTSGLILGTDGLLGNSAREEINLEAVQYFIETNLWGYAQAHPYEPSVSVGDLLKYIGGLNRHVSVGPKDNRSAVWVGNATLKLPETPERRAYLAQQQERRDRPVPQETRQKPNGGAARFLKVGAFIAAGVTILALLNPSPDETPPTQPGPPPPPGGRPTDVAKIPVVDWRSRITPPVDPTNTPEATARPRLNPTATPYAAAGTESTPKPAQKSPVKDQPTETTPATPQTRERLPDRYDMIIAKEVMFRLNPAVGQEKGPIVLVVDDDKSKSPVIEGFTEKAIRDIGEIRKSGKGIVFYFYIEIDEKGKYHYIYEDHKAK